MSIRFRVLAAVLALLPAWGALADEPAPSPDVARELKAYYEDGKKVPPWQAALKRLASDDAAQRKQAADYLRALLAQALKDEESGAAPWRPTPFFGEGPRNAARELRKEIAGALAEAPASAGAIGVVRWFLEEEKLSQLQPTVTKALLKIDGKEAGDLLLELATKPHANATVVVDALNEIGKRKLGIKAEQLAVLCQHHRESIRKAARDVNGKLDFAEPPAFDPARAVQSEPVRKLMDRLGKLILEPAPADAPFVAVTITAYDDKGKKEGEHVVRGWLLSEKGDTWEVLTPFGRRDTYTKKDKPAAEKGERPTTCTFAKEPIKKEVERVAALRKKNDEDFRLSERGGLTGQFQGSGASLYEAMLAHSLYMTKQYDLAATILLPALDTLYLDEHLVAITRDRLGEIHGQQMLVAFVGDRDYDKTLRLARIMAEHFAQTRFHHYAVELARQLPRRRDDFKELKLPTPDEWSKLKKALTREEQVDFLCKRLRLLNCFQWGQPGGVSFSQKQYAEPCGLSENASWGLDRGKTEVINPLVELAGPVDGFFVKGEERPKGLNLTLADIPLLAPHLREDWFILAVSFWRDFHPNRNLHGTRPLVASFINNLAHRDLCEVEKLDKLTEPERDKHIQRIIQWGKDNAGKTETDLLLEAVEAALKAGETWDDVSGRAARLAELKVTKAVPLLLRFLDQKPKGEPDIAQGLLKSLNGSDAAHILRTCRQLDPAAAKEVARKHLGHRDPAVRVQAALIFFETKDKDIAREALAEVLQDADGERLVGWSCTDAIKALLGDKEAESHKAAARLLTDLQLATFREEVRRPIAHAFATASMPEIYHFYLKMLETKGNKLGGTTYGEPVARVFARDVEQGFPDKDKEIAKIQKNTREGSEERLAALRDWLKDQVRRLEKEQK
jgi:hypothetical protein